jgi:mRNA-degrading endonuclease RelE of RelBE toxin-antitoxin system
MMHVQLTQGAIDDLTDLKQSLSPDLWQSTKKQIQDKLNFIEKNPFAHPIPPELEAITTEFRQALTDYYRIIYEIADDQIYVYLICHQARDLASLFFRRLSHHRI